MSKRMNWSRVHSESRMHAHGTERRLSSGGALRQVFAPHFTAGIVVRDERVIDAAPVMRWAIGKELETVLSYARRKGWRVV